MAIVPFQGLGEHDVQFGRHLITAFTSNLRVGADDNVRVRAELVEAGGHEMAQNSLRPGSHDGIAHCFGYDKTDAWPSLR